jgi:hypothetical protein
VCKVTFNIDGSTLVATETTLIKYILDNQKGVTKWETRAVRKIKKNIRNRTTKNISKCLKTSLISSPKEAPDRNHDIQNGIVVGVIQTRPMA